MCSVVKVILFCFCSWALVAGQDINAMKNMPKYDARYDYLDVDGILENKRLIRNYVDCLINAKPCTPEGKALKRVLPEALRTKCVRCTDKQKRTAVKVIRRLKYGYPEEWSKLASRWDPTGDFTRFFEEYLAKETFNTISGTSSEIPASLPPVPPRLPYIPPSTQSPPPPRTTMPATQPPTPAPAPPEGTTAAPPILLNRFGDDGELMMGSHSSAGSMGSPDAPMRPQMPSTRPPTTTTRASTISTRPPMPTMRPVMPSRPPTTIMTWLASNSDAMPTRFPLRPEVPSPQTTMITLIDQIGYKIIRTTELFTDILKNTVKAVVG